MDDQRKLEMEFNKNLKVLALKDPIAEWQLA
jgi:hypothetical protein